MASRHNVNLLWVGILVEGSLMLLAVLISHLNFFDPQQPLAKLGEVPIVNTILMGIVATIPMLGYLLLFHFWRPKFYAPMRQFVDETLRPFFAESGFVELVIISLMAGVGEEIFFRWCLQGGTMALLEPLMGELTAAIISIVAIGVLFGLCHWVNNSYFVIATLAGIYFGLVMWITGSWLIAAISHALFDLAALIYLQRSNPGRST
ncbi:MAG: CPBP family intramembrane glutamic endopeptidase [Planctomycetota bacterium]